MGEVSDYDALIANASLLLIDQAAQVVNLAVTLSHELTQGYPSEHPGSVGGSADSAANSVSVRALKTAIIALLFGVLETLVNLLAGLAVQVTDGGAESIQPQALLVQVERDYLLDQSTVLDTGTGKLRVNRGRFAAVGDKLVVAPVLLAKVLGIEHNLDKTGAGWARLRAFRRLRNALIHPQPVAQPRAEAWESLSDLDKIRPGVRIAVVDLVEAVAGVAWYLDAVSHLLRADRGRGKSDPGQLVGGLGALLSLTMVDLCDASGIPEREFVLRYGLEDFVRPQSPGEDETDADPKA